MLLSLTEMPNTCGITIQLSGPSAKEKERDSGSAVYRFRLFGFCARLYYAKVRALLTEIFFFLLLLFLVYRGFVLVFIIVLNHSFKLIFLAFLL